ncbi:MAG TPA: DUF1525 domain-containing protein [Gemmatimonadales bacterium]|nr:DUF1525 domain-containing protein [Gemmatimonadales bacterium]
MMTPPRRITVEVIAYAPVAFFHCTHCELIWQHTDVTRAVHREQLATSLPADLLDQYQQLSDWVHRMASVHGRRLQFRVVDAASVEGWVKSLRYGVRRYPAVIVDKRVQCTGPEFDRATALIEGRLARVQGESA